MCFITENSFICYLFLFYSLISFLLYIYATCKKRNGVTNNEDRKNRILFLTAHPDDECMFFAPSIISKKGAKSLLCFSTGNYNQKGNIRQHEIVKSCYHLGIPSDLVTVQDIRCLPDDPQVTWDRETVCREIVQHCQKHHINEIYTFDSYGVSGHSNHRALYEAVRYLKYKGGELNDVRCFGLESVNIVRKYISILDLPWSLCASENVIISSPAQVFKAQRAMYAHWSQFVWFRILFILFSRYLIVNTYQEIKVDKRS